MPYLETQESISRWAEETFGSAGTNARVAARMNEEVAELIRAITGGLPIDKVAEEAADIAIVATRLADRVGEKQVFFYTEQEHVINGAPPPFTPLKVALIVQKEMTNLLWMIYAADNEGGSSELLGSQLAVFIVLHLEWLCRLLGRCLRTEIDRKVVINRAREWRRDGTGHGYHVRSGSAAEARA